MLITTIRNLVYLVYLQLLSAKIIPVDYQINRINILEEEAALSLGGHLQLNEEETAVNEILMKLKQMEIEETFNNSQEFKFSRHYFTYRSEIENSELYQIIKRMPKGAALHIHNTFALGADYLISLTYDDHLYACYTDDDLKLQFSDLRPRRPCPTDWTLLAEMRNASKNVNEFDLDLKKYLSLSSDDEKLFESDINTVWKKFNQVYKTIKGLLSYRPVREKFIYETLKHFYDDNVIYIEMRSGLHNLYELNGTVHDKMFMPKLYVEITNKFIEDHPDFIGTKLILTSNRAANITQIREALDLARTIKKDYPELFAGFDLVGQEDQGRPLVDFLPVLIEAKDEMNFYFHGGETNWFGTSTDENLIDAILLGSKRIGHAYALLKHPTLMAAVRERDIALEVNVISNSVLAHVRDVRNHPLATYLALDLPIVLSSDDPGVWGAEPLSHDFYVAFVAVASQHADLRMLKQLALNSIRYSALDDKDKARFEAVFYKRWDSFLKDVIKQNTYLYLEFQLS